MKKLWKMLLLAGVFTVLLCGSALAEEGRSLEAGFYGIEIGNEIVGDVTIKPQDKNGDPVTAVTAAVGSGTATYYEAERLSVTYENAAIEAGDQFVVMLVTGDKLPTDANTICYIDQDAAADDSVAFNVYPLIPATVTEDPAMTLYITSNNGSISTVKIPLKYATAGTYSVAPYKLGNVNEDIEGIVDVSDVALVLNHIVENITLTGNQFLAADVVKDSVVDVSDAAKILNYIVENISTLE